ncbi:MAG: hypothetical protein JO027_07265 [Solirubrobacterales bacterium]|nr:hypothetical protein [Solirubrobacterales bacterium]
MRTDLAASTAEPADARALPAFARPAGTRGRHDQRLRLVTSEPTGLAGQQSGVSPTSSFFICHTLRCGSTLLCDALSSTDLAGYPEEYFPERYADGRAYVATVAALKDPDTWQADWNRTPVQECFDRVLSSGTSPNGVFAAKLKWCNIPYLGEVLGARPSAGGPALSESLSRRFPHLRYVWVTRRDKVRQAVSLVKARQSAQWKALSAPALRTGTLDYNFHVVDRALRRIVEEECAWEQYFTSAGITPLTVVYEDLVRNYEATVRGLLTDLQIALPAEYGFPAPRLHKQADAVSEEWVERYRQDARTSRTWRTVANLPALVTKPHLRETYVMPRLRRRIERVRATGRKLI